MPDRFVPKHVVLSRDPLSPRNSYINTGCMIFKNSEFTRTFLDAVWNAVKARPRYRHEWPYEQAAASDYVLQNRAPFLVCKVTALNTPGGEIVRHIWWKAQFNELADEELRAIFAKHVCADLVQASPSRAFDLADVPDCDGHELEHPNEPKTAGGVMRWLVARMTSISKRSRS